MELIATCSFGLEKLVYDELKKLKLWVIKTEDGRVIFEGDQSSLIRTNLWLRCADRIQIKMGEFQATTFDELFDAVNFLEWENYIGPNDAFPVQATSVKSALHSEPAIQSIVKKAVVKRLQAKHGTENLPENSKTLYQIVVKANKDQFVVSIDSSGESLHRRGYRTQAGLAPIKETLAAAMIKLSDWPASLENRKTTPKNSSARTLVDPFCGSGTFAIEAALLAQNIAPGSRRQFAFHNWPWIEPAKLEEAYLEARNSAHEPEKLPIYSFDIDPENLQIAKANAERAGLENLNFKRSAFQDLDFSRFENCTFIANPPYGERLEETDDVHRLYWEFGLQFSKTKNCSLYLITSDEAFPQIFAEATGLQPDKNRKLFNGNLRCYLYQYESPAFTQISKTSK
jgi:putative N6-adenine-specific DNA methylase